MDKNKIKSFAIWARRNLISAVSEKANRIGIYEDEIREAIPVQGGFKVDGIDGIFPFAKKDRDALVSQIREKGFEQVMEEVAYTWFNRFMGLRYMEVNEYLPSGVRILSSVDKEKKEPDVLTKVSEIIDELELNAEEIYNLLDSGKTDDREKAYRIILVKQCNELGKIIPQMFEKITDYTELLLPDNLLENGSVIRKMVEDIEEDNWKEEVEIIGWMYQYYISEKKDYVDMYVSKGKRVVKEDIPAKTQLFTPKWIVKYMVENSLGRLWLEGHPNKDLQNGWKYYLEEAEQEKEVEEKLKKIREEHAQLTPLDIKVLDPCMGSGHILVYAFDVLYEIYKTAGYSEREIPRLILQNNLYGLDIDDRAAQLASFALIMKARHYNRRLFREIERESIELNLCSIKESNIISEEILNYFSQGDIELKKDVEYLVETFFDAKEYGSLLEVNRVNFNKIDERVECIKKEDNLLFTDYRKIILDILVNIIFQAKIMSSKYHSTITNPPYLGMGLMGERLLEYVKKNHFISKGDLGAVFIEVCRRYTKRNCYTSMITMQSWMYNSMYEKFRDDFLSKYDITTLIHLGARAFEEISGEVVQTSAFVIKDKNNMNGVFVKLIDYDNHIKKEQQFLNSSNYYCSNSYLFSALPGKPISYWIDKKHVGIINENPALETMAKSRPGLQTSDNDRFLRLWQEVEFDNIGINLEREYALKSNFKWFPHNKGGGYRKWYGNIEYIINFKDNGKELKYWIENNPKDPTTKHWSRNLRNYEYYLKEGITWSAMGNKGFSARMNGKGYFFDTSGPMIFGDNLYYICALTNTKVFNLFNKIFSQTLSKSSDSVCKIPLIINENTDKFKKISKIVRDNIRLSKQDWNSFEISWDFEKHPLIEKGEVFSGIGSAFYTWMNQCEKNFNELKHNEEELNRMFIDIYGLQDELTPEVEDKDITIRKADRERDIRSFISYAVGCMFGRYSIDSEGLIYAGGEFNDKWNFEDKLVRNIEKDEEENVVSDTWVNSRFMPYRENIIPITEDEYFEDDIVTRFIEFVKVVYGECNLEENLDFIADSIGRKSTETSRAAIRRYFIKDFYKDHLKVYQKRPIYWMFESGKTDGFKCLVYMHRYNEQTIAKVRTDYLHMLQRKYEAEIERLQLVVDSEQYTAKDRNSAKKKIDRISKQIEECREYDQVVAYLANEKVSIDLDDGVKVNYAKFQNVEIINSKDKKVKMNLLAKI